MCPTAVLATLWLKLLPTCTRYSLCKQRKNTKKLWVYRSQLHFRGTSEFQLCNYNSFLHSDLEDRGFRSITKLTLNWILTLIQKKGASGVIFLFILPQSGAVGNFFHCFLCYGMGHFVLAELANQTLYSLPCYGGRWSPFSQVFYVNWMRFIDKSFN